MSACAGSLTEAFRLQTPDANSLVLTLVSPRNRPDHKRSIFKHFAGQVRMDRARQDWVYEHAETGKPLAACSLHGTRGQDEAFKPRSLRAV